MDDLSTNFTHMGPNGAGQMAKVINQAIVGTNYVMMAEALALAEAAGIDAARLPQCLAGGHADSSGSSIHACRRVISRRRAPTPVSC